MFQQSQQADKLQATENCMYQRAHVVHESKCVSCFGTLYVYI